MKAKSTSKSLKDENLFLFHGDEFLIKQKVSNLIEHLLEPECRTTNLQVFDGSNFDIGDLVSHLLNNPLFGGNRLALVEQTTIFSGQGSIPKVLSRVVEAWKASDSKTAFRNLKQIMGLSRSWFRHRSMRRTCCTVRRRHPSRSSHDRLS